MQRAMEAFWTHGYRGISPAQLADATGITKGSLYNAFPSKRDLFDACLERYQSDLSAMAERLRETPGPTRDAVRFILRSIVDDDLAQPQRRGCLIGNTAVELAGSDPELAKRLRRMQDESTGWFRVRIEQGQADGDVGTDRDAAALAEHCANTLAGLRVSAMTQEADALYRVIDLAVSVL